MSRNVKEDSNSHFVYTKHPLVIMFKKKIKIIDLPFDDFFQKMFMTMEQEVKVTTKAVFTNSVVKVQLTYCYLRFN